MTVVHIVLFEWKSTASPEQISEACTRMLALKEDCIHPTSQKPYIKSFSGGKNISPEGKSGNFTHGFVVEFESEEDRDYYVIKDPAHLEFVKLAGEVASEVNVFDYEPGKM
ncbi:stress responsive A B barrel domain containing protein [Pyrenophora tritici-repentis]|uniref:Stress responsive A-B barrel domain containing protein n=2 Tax=Pyrenophora tritici-repentis TaxID=45151 RepID=A0A2W1DUP8_9PLEO|nr:stress responsive A/B barrel domain containing protein [Pyrenophora tritici-repentis Pt-1C-BFP]KAA8619321.1 stress responsive A/B barrel domain-containing protein [Pyrenophora tritici-repentis]EDU49111.1 stress responsive A/B barrel domain containing protein [Pyrenophora tritici-repentis Pt-1C-BFP]KAF7449793.1 stress responsive A/B barrel domain containing protein [Pyrenophora tritici-repentis]KAF7570080.1 stress responsive A-B barrel domain containing protein [Pyrenophora tritici-repentis]